MDKILGKDLQEILDNLDEYKDPEYMRKTITKMVDNGESAESIEYYILSVEKAH